MGTTKKVRRYVTRRDDRVPYLRSHTVGITSLACVDMASWIQAEYIKVWLASLACVDMASWHRVPKGQAESHGDVIDMTMSTFEIIGMPDR